MENFDHVLHVMLNTIFLLVRKCLVCKKIPFWQSAKVTLWGTWTKTEADHCLIFTRDSNEHQLPSILAFVLGAVLQVQFQGVVEKINKTIRSDIHRGVNGLTDMQENVLDNYLENGADWKQCWQLSNFHTISRS